MNTASGTAGLCTQKADDLRITRTWPRMLLVSALLLLMLLCSFYYLPGVLIPAAGEMAGKTPGFRSDLYPPWLAAREFLLHGRDPYSADVTREIQRGIYGKVLPGQAAGSAVDEQRFAYPLFTALLLLPLIAIPFAILQPIAAIGAFACTVCALLIWLKCWDIHVNSAGQVFWLGLLLVWIPVVQGVWLQQLGLLVCLLLAGSVWALRAQRLVLSGILLALAAIKPQLALPFAMFLAFWVAGDWRRRYKLPLSAAATVLILVLSSGALQPGWISEWLHMLREYRRYTQAQSFMEILAGNTMAALALSAALWFIAGFMCFRLRRSEPTSRGFAAGLSVAVCAGMLTSPNWQMHNQVILFAAATWLFLSEAKLLRGPRAIPVVACKGAVLWYGAIVTVVVLAQVAGLRTANRDLLTIPLASTFFAPPLFMAATLFSTFQVLRRRGAAAEKAAAVHSRSAQ